MAAGHSDADILESPSSNDTEAASQQLLAEASSPVQSSTAAPVSASAILGANLLNHARTLSKPPVAAPTASKENAGKLPKMGQLKSVQLKPVRLERPGKLARASLSSLVAEAPISKVRGDKMYDIDPSPQKKRPHSLPPWAADLARESLSKDVVVAREDDDIVPETSQARPEEIPPAKRLRGHEAQVASGQAKQPDVLRATSLHESTAAPKKRRGRPRNSGESAAPGPLPEASTSNQQDAGEGLEVDHVPSSPPKQVPRDEEPAATKKRRGRPHKSGESTASTQPPDGEQTSTHEMMDPPVLSPKLKRKAQSREQQNGETNVESSRKSAQVRKQRRLRGPVTISPDVLEFDEDLIPSNLASRDAHFSNDLQPALDIPTRSSRSRTARAETEMLNAQEHSATALITAKTKPAHHPQWSTRLAQAMSVPEQSKQKPAPKGRPPKRKTAPNDEQIAEPSKDVSKEPTTDQDQLGGAQNDAESNMAVSDNDPDGERSGEDEEDEDQYPDDQDRQGQSEQGNEAAELEEDQPSTLNKAFDFADSLERAGSCSTKLGRTIHRRCERFRGILSRRDPSLEDIAKCNDHFVELLQSINVQVQEESRPTFKRDAYAYLFRDLMMALKAMCNKLRDRQVGIAESSDHMQVVYRFIRQLLRFKDIMDSWKVVVHSRTKGDKLIRGVETGLIAPLRAFEKEYGRDLQRLQQAEQFRRAAVEAQRYQEKNEQEAIRREEALRRVRERRKRWQELHIARMQVEPDPSRRRRLRFVEPIQIAETDANGQPFERVPVFGERSAPPPQWAVVSSSREWTTEQEAALLDALQSSASLERMFRTHCGPHGVLRDFSVSDIVAKLAWVRSGWAQLSHQHGWEVPDWVKSIPVLP